MEAIDIQLLKEMCRAIDAYRSNAINLGRLADRLLELRDGLHFVDNVWYHELTQHIATLDSGSTFVPKDEKQTGQRSHTIEIAIDGLLKLIENKLAR